MKLFLLCLVVIFAVLEAKAAPSNSQDEDARWETFKIKHAKSYKTSAEHSQRKKNFAKHLAKIDAHNSDPNNSFTLGVNKYADEDNEEFVKTMNGFKEPSSASSLSAVAATIVNPTTTAPLPASVDWRTSGAVTPVKDQGQCGSCWSFSSTGSLEGHTFRKTGKLVSLSEQNLVDCNTQNSGCNGGWMDYAFNYIKTNKGIDTAASYPYKAVGGTCKFNAATIGATDTGFVRITPGNETALQIAVATLGPVAVAIDASHNSFQLYSSGVYSETACNPNYLDHAVLVVGYGTYNGKNYWLVKNSWGTSWGMAGYIMMPRNSNNYCGIASHAVYPTV